MSDDFKMKRRNTPKALELLERKQDNLKRAIALTQEADTTPKAKIKKPSKKRISAYKILGVEQNISHDKLVAAYRSKAMQWHPDKHFGESKAKAIKFFQLINAAFEKVSTEEKRYKYDKLLRARDEEAYSFNQIRAASANDNKQAFAHKALQALETIFWPFEGQDSKPNKGVDTNHFGL
jgi:curved DNA-binding protein CbpA